ncbi:hypothetical protein PsYK624_157460 [Phanerochaete sordida]|uniref:DUF6534 domain-containing protein n=1 Tax=Phanerochaete sordida TaxID=48140 RepID=A0A9P3GPR3_9APHY|nr:hypothetical protein PsYK624_157460 [Phanerochaete sordida]
MSAAPSIPGTAPGTAPPSGMPALDVNSTFGAVLVGGLVASVLYGITVLQAFSYYQQGAKNDGWLTRVVVAALWLIDTFDMALLSHIIYIYLVTNYGNPSALMQPILWSMSAHLMTTATTEVIVRSMFSLRVWKLSGGKWVPAFVVGLFTLLDLIFGIIVTVKSEGQTFFELARIQAWVVTQFAMGLTGDTLIALLLSYYLYHSRTGFSRTDSIVTILMAYVINTGLLTAIALTVNIVLFATEKRNFAFVALYFVISKLYVNAYLAMLNARTGIRQRMSQPEALALPGNRSRYTNSSAYALSPKVETEARSQESRPSVKTSFRDSLASGAPGEARSVVHFGDRGSPVDKSDTLV